MLWVSKLACELTGQRATSVHPPEFLSLSAILCLELRCLLTAAVCHPTVSDRCVAVMLYARPRHTHTDYFLHFPPFYLEIGGVVLGCVWILAVA